MKERLKIISGGQTGVDRAALDFAIRHGISYGGWCPQDGLAEDMPEAPGLLSRYPELQETEDADYLTRTRLNVEDSDATLVLADRPDAITTSGTGYTVQYAEKMKKPYRTVVIGAEGEPDATLEWLRKMAEQHTPLRLNLAGPRESKSAGVYQKSLTFLEELLKNAECD